MELLSSMQQQSGGPVLVGELWKASGLDADTFYSFTAVEIEAGRMCESRHEYNVFLEAVDAHQGTAH